MDFLPPEISAYVEAHTQEESPVLRELNRETYANLVMPRMLAGHLQGQVLKMLSHMIQPMQILEIGTFTGYSAICLAEGLNPGGRLHSIDINEELADMVHRYFKKANVANKISYLVGDAVKIIPHINEIFDLVFIDADKENYSNYYDLVFDKVRQGGYIIADNVLWSGKVLEDRKSMDKDTLAIDDFNNRIYKDSRVEKVIFPIRDGMMVVRKK